MPVSKTLHRNLIYLLFLSTVIRGLIAGFFELGNDEVYYWTYAVYPDLSHFDHPPMVGWLIRIFTFNLHFQQEFFLRLASVLGGTLNTWLLYRIGKKLKDEQTGWYAALLYTASIYGFVITGIFILPDTPQTAFWLLALLLMLDTLPNQQPDGQDSRNMLRIGILLGLGLLSKYTTVFLWIGMVLFILFFNRLWLRKWAFYVANLVMMGFFSIVLLWNAQNHFISFAYQGGRAGIKEAIFNFDSFLMEIGGEILYTNPVNFVLILLALFALFRSSLLRKDPKTRLLLFSALPLILLFLLLSFFRNTLPHWSGPGYISLIPLAALWIREKKPGSDRLFPHPVPLLAGALGTMVLIVGVSAVQITTGVIKLGAEEDLQGMKGKKDYSLEVVGWKQLGEKFKLLSAKFEKAGEMQPDAPIVSYRWFPAANLEYYVARPTGRVIMATGDLDAIHKYAWINRIHGGFRLNSDAWYITSSRDFRDPRMLKPLYYEKIMPPDTLVINRYGKIAYYFYVYRLVNLQSKPADLPGPTSK